MRGTVLRKYDCALMGSYAKSFVPLGLEEDGRVPGIATTGANPFATVAQLQDFTAALAAGQPGEAWEVLPGFNPFYGVPLEVLTGGGRARYQEGNRFGLLGS